MKSSNIDRKQWADFADQSPNATFFHHPLWYSIWDKIYGWKSEAILFDADTNLVVPFLHRKRVRNIFSEYRSGPAGVYGGLFGLNDKAATIDLVKSINAAFSFVEIVDNINLSIPTTTAPSKKIVTHIIRLNEQSFIEMIGAWSDSHKRVLKKAEGFTFHLAKSEKDWNDYFELYESSINRWGDAASSQYPKPLFEEIQQLPKDKSNLYLVKKNDRLLSGAIVFGHNGKYNYWHGAASEAGLTSGSSIWLQYKIIERLQAAQGQVYDLGPSAGHTGVAEFKRRMGATEIAINVYNKQPFWAKFLSS